MRREGGDTSNRGKGGGANSPADLAPLEELNDASAEPAGDLDSHQQSSRRAKQAFDSAVKAAEAGDEGRAIQEYVRCAAAAEAAHEWFLVAMACQRVGDFLLTSGPPRDVPRALRMFGRAAAAFERSGLYADAREISYRVMVLRLCSFNDIELTWIQRTELLLYWLTAGFGYRPLRVIGTAVVLIVAYGFLFWIIGGAVDLNTRKVAGLADSLYFSGITFTTVGYGDFFPAPHARLLALSEGFLGAFLMGFFVIVLAQRFAKA